MYLIEKHFIAKKCQPLSEPSVSHSLFAGGGVEILAELPKCDTETEMSECRWKNRADSLGRSRVATNLQSVKITISAEHNRTRYACKYSCYTVVHDEVN